MDIKLIVEELIKRGLTISFAESLTGGLVCSALVSIPNASKVLNESYITYSNEAKKRILNVPNELILEYDVVSEEVAYMMAKGVKEISSADIGISVTGLAGPTGGTELIPIGTVCFGFAIDNKIYTYRRFFPNLGRDGVRNAAVNYIYDTLYDLLFQK